MKRFLFFITILLFAGFSVNAQQEITGTVTNAESGDPIPGVTIYVQGQQTFGTTTDMDGNYTLTGVPEDAEALVFSFVGMETQQVSIQGRSQIDVQLKSTAQELEEVVVTALGIERENKRLGYSVSEVSGDEVAEANAINPVEALQGKAAGINISSTDAGAFGGSKFSIRGASTLESNNMPIFVVDGVILDNKTSGGSEWSGSPNDWGNQLRNLNPQNFESVSILKGSAATALYGSRAINGAVVIETKSGQKGEGLGIQVSQTTSAQYVYDTPELQNEFGPGTLAGYVSYGETDEDGDYYRFDPGSQFNYRTMDGEEVPTLIGSSGLNFGPRFSSLDQIQGYDQEMTSYQAYPDNWKNAYETGISSNTDITLRGGTDQTTFYMNSSIKLDKGIYPREQFNKYSGMLKASHDLADFLTIHGSVSYTHSNPKNPPHNFGDDYTAYSFSRAYSTEKYVDSDVYVADHGGVPNNAFGDENGYVPGNSIWFSVYKNTDERTENTWRPILRLTADATDWLSFTLEGNMNIYSYRSETKNLGQDYQNEGGYYQLYHHYEQQETGKLTATLNREFGDFTFDATLGGEIYHTKTSESGANTNGGFVVPGQFFLDNSKEDRDNWSWIGGEKQISSAYALLSFSWNDQVYLDLTGRNDWSSSLVYADESGDYSYFYPSISGSWIFSETFTMPGWMSFGKLRASWARVGNDTNPYEINQGYGVNTLQTESGFIYTNGFDRTLISPNLSPEQKRSIELGADIRFFNGRLGLDFTYYKENTFKQILSVPAPTTSGVTSQMVNAGNIQNQGIEASLNTTPIQTNDFEWNLDFHYTRNRNKIISLHEDVGDYKLLAGSPTYGNYRIGSAAYIGGDYGVLLSDILPATNDNGEKILNWDNTSRSAYYKRSGDVQRIGSIQPDFVGSVSNSFRYKNWNFSFLIDGRFGGDVASFTNRYGTAWGYMETSTDNLDAEHGGMTWTSQYPDTQGRTYDDGVIPEGVFADGTEIQGPDGNVHDVSGMSYQEAYDQGYVEPSHASAHTYWNHSWGAGVITDNWFYELNYLALRNVGINYTLPASFARSIGFQSMSVGLKARNVLYLYNSSPNDMHPEGFRGNQSDYSYFERTPQPYSRTISLRLNVGF